MTTGAETPTAAPASALSLPDFVAYLAEELAIAPEDLAPHAHFEDDLGFDSLDKLEVLVAVEELGVELNDEFLRLFNTVEEAHRLYVWAAARDDERAPVPPS